jgi:hypothetical protein
MGLSPTSSSWPAATHSSPINRGCRRGLASLLILLLPLTLHTKKHLETINHGASTAARRGRRTSSGHPAASPPPRCDGCPRCYRDRSHSCSGIYKVIISYTPMHCRTIGRANLGCGHPRKIEIFPLPHKHQSYQWIYRFFFYLNILILPYGK